MAHVRKTQQGTWECRWSWYDGDGKRHFQKRRFPTAAAAKQHARDIDNRNAASQSLDQNPGKVALRVWAERWYDSLSAAGTHKPSTLRGYRKILDSSVLPALGGRPVAGITTADVRDFVTTLHGTGKAAPTIRHHYGVLRSVLGFAAEDGAISLNPAVGVKRLPTDRAAGRLKPRPTALTEDEVERLAAQLDATEPVYGLVIRFMAYTGLRAGEVAGLNIADVDFLGSRLLVRRTRTKIKGGWEVHTPKNGQARIVPLPTWLRDDLAAYLTTHPHAADREQPLWPGRTNGGQKRFQHATGSLDYSKPWERDAFYKRQFRPALQRAGLRPVRLHDLRHTAGSIMLSRGIEPYRVAQYLGHSLAVLTQIYAHILDGDMRTDMNRLSRPERSARGHSGL